MKPIHTEQRNGFEIAFYALPEDTDPADSFDIQEGDDTLERIASGYYDWFCARVTASKAGIVLGDDYLGCCCYESASNFPEDSGCYEDMVQTAIANACGAI